MRATSFTPLSRERHVSARGRSNAGRWWQLLAWDVKDTQLRVHYLISELYSSEAKLHGIQVEAKVLDRSFLPAIRVQDELFPSCGLGWGLSSQQRWGDIIKRTFQLCGVNQEQVLSPLAENLYRGFGSTRNWEVFADVRDILTHMAVISNFDHCLEQTLANCKLWQHFDYVLTSDDIGAVKPDPRIFVKAVGIAQVEPKQATHVGDDVWKDYLVARTMESYLICREEEEPVGVKGLVPR
ncbi:haloacid dehalogenase-like hydrolase domain-containing protein 3 [Heptranchias perlo]|uniref:haloacid dehalogenase-like hydrolase domain-containing protein 3 n=1 Tax=Heptranchias perlo TaxID=212740 RepID=UPI003559E904